VGAGRLQGQEPGAGSFQNPLWNHRHGPGRQDQPVLRVGRKRRALGRGQCATTLKAMAQKFQKMPRCRVANRGNAFVMGEPVASNLGFQNDCRQRGRCKNDRVDAEMLARVDPEGATAC
jgi:hypothetical protein